jgi:segregation and condensation protein B
LPERRVALLRDLEALLFAAGRPLSLAALCAALAHHGPLQTAEIAGLLEELSSTYSIDGPHGFELVQVADGWAFRTNRLACQALDALLASGDSTRLSPAALETLAIVAYSQPVSRPEIAEVRGVNSDSVLQTLLERELVREVGRSEGPGGAILYGTTERFQVVFGLESLASLPELEGFAPGEDERQELRRRLGLSLAD